MTIKAVMTKNSGQFPPVQSTNQPPLEIANTVRPALPIDANSAYWVAEKALPVSAVRKLTNATVENAVVKLSVKMARRSMDLSGPAIASHANNKLLPAIVTPPINRPRVTPKCTLMTLPINAKMQVASPPYSFW